MYSDNLWEVAIRNQLWKEGDPHLDFLKTYGMARYHPVYATRRIWRIFNLAAPSYWLPENTNMWADDYPFSVPVDRVLTPQDLMNFQVSTCCLMSYLLLILDCECVERSL